jgi:hypothetical protein
MKPHELMIGVLTGCVLVVFGLVPGLSYGLTEGVRNFLDLVSSGLPVSPPRHTEYDKLERPIWLAGLGAVLIVLSVLAYLSN